MAREGFPPSIIGDVKPLCQWVFESGALNIYGFWKACITIRLKLRYKSHELLRVCQWQIWGKKLKHFLHSVMTLDRDVIFVTNFGKIDWVMSKNKTKRLNKRTKTLKEKKDGTYWKLEEKSSKRSKFVIVFLATVMLSLWARWHHTVIMMDANMVEMKHFYDMHHLLFIRIFATFLGVLNFWRRKWRPGVSYTRLEHIFHWF